MMASRTPLSVALRGAIRTPTAAAFLRRSGPRLCYSTEHHQYTGNTGEHHAHQDAMPKAKNFAAAVGDKMSPKYKAEKWQPLNAQQWEGAQQGSGGGQKQGGKKWDREQEREFQDKEWDNIGNL
ncbi:hypothetical protein PG993_011990 [Apiospora rasikravindrae]|uniref:Uncharacterized protein n=1 Tax=Apiospora rasikravindrae TaxID=990691 RepID=A0ABR1S168_9PEZI